MKAFCRPLEEPERNADGLVRRRSAVRVCFVSSHARAGGSEAYLIRLLRSIPREQISTVVALEHGPLVEALTQDGHVVDVIPATGKLSSIAGAARALRRSIDVADVDVIHANGIKAGLVVALARTGVPFVWVKHDFSLDGIPARFVAARADRVVGRELGRSRCAPDQARRASERGLHRRRHSTGDRVVARDSSSRRFERTTRTL